MMSDMLACPICGWEGRTLPILKRHVRMRHKPVCLACGRTFDTWLGVALHIQHTREKLCGDVDVRALTYWIATTITKRKSDENRRKFHKGQDVALDVLAAGGVGIDVHVPPL